MNSRSCLVHAIVCVFVIPAVGSAQAQSSDVTFRAPVNLTHLSPDITDVQLFCKVMSPAIPMVPGVGASAQRANMLPAAGGQFVRTVTVVVPIPQLNNPVGKSATYDCRLLGRDKAGVFAEFNESHPKPQFRVSPTPAPIIGSFDWVSVDANAPPPPSSTTSPGGQP